MKLKPYPEYKNSGLPWIDNLPNKWQVCRAKNVFRVIDVRSITGEEELLTVSSKYGVLPRRNATVTMFKADSYKGYKLCWPGDLVINSLWAWMQGLGVSKYHGIISTAYGVYRLKDVFLHYYRYFDYLLRSQAYLWELRTRSKGIWRSRLQLMDDAFLCIPLLMPSYEEQQKIVTFLDSQTKQISRFIRGKRRLIELLKEQKQAIINRAVTRGLDPNVRLKPSGIDWLGDIPEHWELRRFKFLVKISKGQIDPRNENYKNFILIAPNHIEIGTGKILFTETANEQAAESGKYFVKKGQIIYSKIRPNLRKAALSPFDCLCSADMYAIDVDKSIILPDFFLILLLSNSFTKYTVDYSMRVAMPKINREALGNCLLAYPSLDEQREILVVLKNDFSLFDKKIFNAEQEIALIREYRTRLVADVVTGKIDVRDVPVAESPEIPDIEETEEIDYANEPADADETGEAPDEDD